MLCCFILQSLCMPAKVLSQLASVDAQGLPVRRKLKYAEGEIFFWMFLDVFCQGVDLLQR